MPSAAASTTGSRPPGMGVGSRVCAAPPAQPPVFAVVVTGETVIVLLRGELDVTIEGFLNGRLLRIREMKPTRLVFETAQVTYLDCASARLIAGTGDWLPAGVKPVVSRPSPIVRRVLLASGIGAFCELGP
ncbi:MAG TPA: STAS domain-containing protein [Dongiaceae bacterium]